jgi:ubiquitin fusion degradation protein 1
MLFQLQCDLNQRNTHSGVLEFTAQEGCVYIPFWMMQNLKIEEGALITVKNVSLPKATFVKLQPQSVDFLEITNPRAVLEHALRNFSCVTAGDIIQIPYNNKNYCLELKDVEPSPAACIIETDCNVDFDPPVGYQEPVVNRSSGTKETAASDSAAINVDSIEDKEQDTTTKPPGVRIMDGTIIRPTDTSSPARIRSDMLADRTGQTGVQRNAAIPLVAPPIDYWAIAAGDGARLDGKTATPLKDTSGREINISQLRAEAAAARAAATAANINGATTSSGLLLNGAQPATMTAEPAVPAVKQRVSRVGNKFSRLKASGTAFQGNANSFGK